MYEVICMFSDLQDFNHVYNVGDKFPRIGTKVSDKRIAELSSNKNKRKKPLIKLVGKQKEVNANIPTASEIIYHKTEDESVDIDFNYTKTDINRLNKADLVTLATKKGIKNAEEKSGSDLKKILIKYFNL